MGSALCGRFWSAGFWVCVVALGATAIVGRYFCGHVCPMGVTVDMAGACLDRLRQGRDARWVKHGAWPWVKHGVLLAVLAAGVLGVSLVFLVAPIPLATRFWGQLIHPAAAAAGEQALGGLRPLADAFNAPWLAFVDIHTPRYAGQLFILLFFLGVLGLGAAAPRFWCRYLCPAGAAFALSSFRPLLRRRVSEACIDCGQCAKHCPMQAIPDDYRRTAHAECIVCESCVRICPVNAVDFGPPRRSQPAVAIAPGRREVIIALPAGALLGLLAVAELGSGYVAAGAGRADAPHPLRPPGALPDAKFLARCVRCGLCMEACPTNTLQPAGLQAGWAAAFAPTVTPARGPCEPLCQRCTLVCPTLALRPLDAQEKIYAKLGTAYVLRHKCLAWELGKECLVCDEVCPYNAIELRMVPESPVPVPFVTENRCAGCGFCEHHCPVRSQRAIVVEPMGELRLASGTYTAAAQTQGLELSLHHKKDEAAVYPNGENYGGTGLPPGFSDPE